MESNSANSPTNYKGTKIQGLIILDNAHSDEPKNNKISSYYGFLCALLSALCNSVSNVLVKKSNFFNGTDMALFRYIIQLIFMLIIGSITKTNLLGPKDVRNYLLLVGFFNVLTVLTIFFSIKSIDPSESTALFSMNLAITPIIARIYLKEKFGIINFLPLIISIIGVCLISQPSFLFKEKIDFNNQNGLNSTNISSITKDLDKVLGITAGLCSALFYASMTIFIKKLANRKIHYSLTVIYSSYVSVPLTFSLSLVLFLSDIQKYDVKLVQDLPSIVYQILFAISSGVFGVLFQIFLNIALKYETTTNVSMICSTSLFFTFLLQFLILNISSNLSSTLGACMIFLATLMTIVFQRLEKFLLSDKNIQGNNNNQNLKSLWKKILFFKL